MVGGLGWFEEETHEDKAARVDDKAAEVEESNLV